jgi:serine/threonine protein kinase
VSGLSPFAGECDVETMGNVTVGKYDFNDEAFDKVSPECIDFITKLLVKEQDDRMTAKQALRHRWIKKKPQYQPTNPKPSNPLSFKAVYMDKVSLIEFRKQANVSGVNSNFSHCH